MKYSQKAQEEFILQLQKKFGTHILEPVEMGIDEHDLKLTLPRLRVEWGGPQMTDTLLCRFSN